MRARRKRAALVDLARTRVPCISSVAAIAVVAAFCVGAEAVVVARRGTRLHALIHVEIALCAAKARVCAVAGVAPPGVAADATVLADVVCTFVDVGRAVVPAVPCAIAVALVHTILVGVDAFPVVLAHGLAAFRALVNVHRSNDGNVIDSPPPVIACV